MLIANHFDRKIPHCDEIESRTRRGVAVHEMSIAQSLLDIILEESSRHSITQVKQVNLQIGAMAAIVPESLSFCFELLSRDTLVGGASLAIETIPVVARCRDCSINYEVENQVFLCPQCGMPSLELISGRELSVVSIEGETGEGDGSD
jgi:hydrogenase nickel incorporation protein HypA/HybF